MTQCWCGFSLTSTHTHTCLRPPGPAEPPPVYEVRETDDQGGWNLFLVGDTAPAAPPSNWKTGSRIEFTSTSDEWCYTAHAGKWSCQEGGFPTKQEAYGAAKVALAERSRVTGESL